MATVVVNQNQSKNLRGTSPYGNRATLRYSLKTDATGAVIGAVGPQVPLAIGDVVKLGPLPSGLRIVDSQVIVVTGMTASVTGSLGYDYADGDDSAETVKKDPAFLGTALALATAARVRNTVAKAPVKLEKAGVVTLTIAGAANAKASEIEVLVDVLIEGEA